MSSISPRGPFAPRLGWATSVGLKTCSIRTRISWSERYLKRLPQRFCASEVNRISSGSSIENSSFKTWIIPRSPLLGRSGLPHSYSIYRLFPGCLFVRIGRAVSPLPRPILRQPFAEARYFRATARMIWCSTWLDIWTTIAANITFAPCFRRKTRWS